MKKVCSLILMLMMLTSFSSLPLYANRIDDVHMNELQQTRFSHINVFISGFDITDSGKAEVSAYLDTRNASSVKIKTYLQQYENGRWKTIKSWSEKAKDTNVGLGKSYYVASGYTYRMKSYAYVYDDSYLVEKTSSVSKEIRY